MYAPPTIPFVYFFVLFVYKTYKNKNLTWQCCVCVCVVFRKSYAFQTDQDTIQCFILRHLIVLTLGIRWIKLIYIYVYNYIYLYNGWKEKNKGWPPSNNILYHQITNKSLVLISKFYDAESWNQSIKIMFISIYSQKKQQIQF